MIESLLFCHFHILVGIFHYRTWPVYSNDGLPQNALGLHEQASWMHTHLVFLLSFHTFIALVHPLHGNPYSLHWHQLMGISLAHWSAASMWGFLLFCLLHTTPIIIFYSTHSAMSMAHAHILPEDWKSLRTPKVWNNCLDCHRGCAWFEYFVWWRWSIARLYDFVGITFFGHFILKRHDCIISRLEVLLFLCQMIDYCFESLVS